MGIACKTSPEDPDMTDIPRENVQSTHGRRHGNPFTAYSDHGIRLAGLLVGHDTTGGPVRVLETHHAPSYYGTRRHQGRAAHG